MSNQNDTVNDAPVAPWSPAKIKLLLEAFSDGTAVISSFNRQAAAVLGARGLLTISGDTAMLTEAGRALVIAFFWMPAPTKVCRWYDCNGTDVTPKMPE